MLSKSFSNVHLVTIALGNLGGHEKLVDSEDIAIHVNELAPGKFTWRKYPEHIDIQVVNQSLQDARRKRNGALVIGTGSKGWMLSKAGMEWFKHVNYKDGGRKESSLSLRRDSLLGSQKLEMRRLSNSRAYQLHSSGKSDEITRNDFFEFAKINEYFSLKARQRRYDFVTSTISQDEKMQSLWQYFQVQFAQEFE